MLDLAALSSQYRFSHDILVELQRVYGQELERVVRALKSPPRWYYIRVNTIRTTVEELQSRFEQRGWRLQRHPVIDEALFFEVDGPLEVPRFEKRLVVDKFTAESVLCGANVYAPGIVGCSGVRRGNNVSILNDQGEIVGAGVATMSEREILALRRGLAVELQHPRYRLPSLRETEEYSKGLFYSQSLPAMLTTRILDPKPGETLVDLTCSPGGKLSHLFQLTKGEADIIGFDRNSRKIRLTECTLDRLGFDAKLVVHDSRYLDVDFPDLEADRCLIDPPCSALGVRPKTYEFTSHHEVSALCQYQQQFLKAAAGILRNGGVAVYSVCTMTAQECEEVAAFAATQCGLQPEPQSIFLGSRGLDGCPNGELLQRFHPHLHDCGYFIARFRKES